MFCMQNDFEAIVCLYVFLNLTLLSFNNTKESIHVKHFIMYKWNIKSHTLTTTGALRWLKTKLRLPPVDCSLIFLEHKVLTL